MRDKSSTAGKVWIKSPMLDKRTNSVFIGYIAFLPLMFHVKHI